MPTSVRQILQLNGYEIPVSNLDKVYWPEEGITKGDIIEYYIRVWPWLGPHLYGRPLSLVRYPEGIKGDFFYQKNFPDPPPWVQVLPVETNERTVHYAMANNLETLIWSINLGCIEVHPWLSRYDQLDRPTYVIFDLDPMPPAGFMEALEIAFAIRELTQTLKLACFPKVSGATGIHIYLPIKRLYTYKQTSTFVKHLGEIIIEAMPQRATNERKIQMRSGKVYIDHLQNLQGKTIASVYSIRPFPGAPVSMACTWEELKRFEPNSFNNQNAPLRLAERGDFFSELLHTEQTLPQKLLI
jgi:bifunctional non-homologous end joining protein LigD